MDVKATRATQRPRATKGSLGVTLYAAAFVCMLVAGGILAFAAKEFFKTTVTLWVSVGFSVLAVILAVVSLVSGRRS
jgi:hypothetical protein